MPTFEYQCLNPECVIDSWEDLYLPGEDLPTACPECNGPIQKLVSLVAQGVVKLHGHDLKAKVKEDAKKMIAESHRDENLLANLVGENKYQQNQTIAKKISANRPKIKYKKSQAP